VDIEDVYATAMAHYRQREFARAQDLCRSILDHDPSDVRSLVLLGDMAQQSGRNKLAVKLLGQALALDCENVSAHDTIAMAYEALGRRDEAARHFRQAIALGLAGVPALIKQSAAVAGPLKRLADAWPRQLSLAELLGANGPGSIAGETLLVALLQSRVIHDLELERLLTAVRRGLLRQAAENAALAMDAQTLEFCSALAQQCFLNQYVFAVGDLERAQLRQVHDRVAEALRAGAEIISRDLLATASYLPLHTLAMASALLERDWPDTLDLVLAQQIRQPLEEEADRDNIPILTAIDDPVSLQVQNQYEESPYPRWTTVPSIKPTTVVNYVCDKLGVLPESWSSSTVGVEILVAGCGTGSHSIDTAQRFPQAQVLAIDISRTSLAYARRKTRTLGLTNVEYAQADILKLGALDRRFDVIEAVGVLHHLSDPEAGWRLLLSLLRPNGLMYVGLYSALARQSLDPVRAFIAESGYRATPEDIRACRQELIQRGRMPPFRDFSSTSGCRDLLFNVMEHQFTIPRIKAFLDANHLRFLGIEQLQPHVLEQFRQQFPDTAAKRDLSAWHSFEQAHPTTFGNMYFFWVQKSAPHGPADQ
jgi:2-polyprenyl-3-methyl-5-hydroxy-6-metoxy-1,4-benzoquinol methylase